MQPVFLHMFFRKNIPLILTRIWQLLIFITLRRKIDICVAFLLMALSGISEVLTLASIIPFMGYLFGDTSLLSVKFSGSILPLSLIFSSVWGLGGLLIGVVILSSLLRLANSWWLLRISALVGVEISSLVYQRTLCRPYVEHLSSNSGELISLISLQVDRTVAVVKEFLQLLVALTISISITIGLLLIDFGFTLILFSILGASYFLIAFYTKQRLNKNGLTVARKGEEKIKVLQEGLGSIRDVILDNSQTLHIKSFTRADGPLRFASAESGFLSIFPRYFIEGIAMVLVILLTMFLSGDSSSSSKSFIPILSAFTLGAQKLLPSLQQIYGSWAIMSSMQASVETVLDALNKPSNALVTESIAPLQWGKSINLINVSYRHPHSASFSIDSVNLKIEKGEKIGFIGPTGSGKSTLVDIIMGLLAPSELGRIEVDGITINDLEKPELLLSWQQAISHVPQTIFLSDGTIEENIAFGLPSNLIDNTRVQKSAELAQIASFVESQPSGYKTKVGERGIRLSGGQRQRIGIARAFYKSSDLLIFDEATSALDEFTESQVIDSVFSSRPEITVIMIAHRLSTLRSCDRIFEIREGSLVKQMTGDQMFRQYLEGKLV